MAAQDAGHSNQSPKPKQGRPRRRRWPWIVLGVVVVIVVLVALLPAIASTATVRGYITAGISDSIAGQVQIDDLSLSWSGPMVIEGFRLYEPKGQVVSSVKQLRIQSGLWGAMGSHLGQVTLDEPQIALVSGPDGQTTLAQAVEPTHPSPAKPQAPLPKWLRGLTGQVRVRSGTAIVSLAGGQTYHLQQVQADVDINTLSNLAGTFGLLLAEGGSISGQGRVSDLVQDGYIRPAAAAGTVKVQTDQPVQLGPMLAMLQVQPAVQGVGTLSLDAQFSKGSLQGTLATDVKNLVAVGPRYTGAQPMNANLSADANLNPDRLTGKAQLAGDAGEVVADFDFQTQPPPQSQAMSFTAGGVATALLAGNHVALPPGQLNLKGRLDLARLAQSVPGLLRLNPEVTLTGGQIAIPRLEARTGEQSTFTGRIEATGLVADVRGRTTPLEPMQAQWDVALAPQTGLRIQQATVQTAFANLRASGAGSDLSGEFRVSLADFQRQFGPILQLDQTDLGGAVTGTLRLSGNKDQTKTSLTIQADNLVYRTPSIAVQVPQARLTQAGRLEMAGGSLARIVNDQLQFSLADVMTAQATGWLATSGDAYKVDLQAQVTDVGRLLQMVQTASTRDVQISSNQVAIEGHFDKAAADQQALGHVKATVQGLRRQGRVLEPQAVLEVDGLTLAPQGRLGVQSVNLQSQAATLQAKDIRYQSQPAQLSAQVDLRADLDRAMQLAAAVSGAAQPAALAGQLTYNGRISSAGEITNLTGSGQIDDLVVGAGAQQVRQGRVEFTHDAAWTPSRQLVELRKASVQSAPLKLNATGQVSECTTRRVLDLKGNYDLSWDSVMAVLAQLSPQTAANVSLKGQSASDFSVQGPLKTPGAGVPYRDLDATGTLSWTSGTFYGLPLGAAKLGPRMQKGMVDVPMVEIPSGTGMVRMAGQMDLTGSEPVLRAPQQLQVLQNLPVDQQTGNLLLSRFNPMFAKLTQLQGQVNMTTQDIALPLGPSLKTGGAGQGRLSLGSMQLQGTGLLAELLQLAGQAGGQQGAAIQFTDLDFTIHDGAIYYDNFGMELGQGINLVFRGSVGFDDTVKLWVGVPLTPQLLQKLGVGGLAAQYAQALAGTRLEIAIVGARGLARLDFSRVDVRGLVRQATQQMLRQGLGQQLEGVLGGAEASPAPKPPAQPPAQPQPQPQRQPPRRR